MSDGVSGSGASPDLADPQRFAHWTTEKIRFQDIDRLDHVNNVALAAYAESGRVEFLESLAPDMLYQRGAPFWVIAQLNIRFLAQSRFPGQVRIGTCVLRIGNTSATLGQGMFHGDTCIATAESVVVLVDPETGRGHALPEEVRSALVSCLQGEGAGGA